MVGLDVEYVRGRTDEELLSRARVEERTVLTRDVQLAARAPLAVLIRSPDLEQQWRELLARFAEWPTDVAFARCTLCNGSLEPDAVPPREPEEGGRRLGPVYRCRECGHRYWEGSHTAEVRRRIAKWAAESRR